MHYLLTMNEVDSDFAKRIDPIEAGPYWGAWSAYSKSIAEAGIFIAAGGLEPPSTATTLRVRGGQTQVQDGPYADTKEQLAGFWVINVPDLDTALLWAAKAPAAHSGSVEVRPVLPPPPTGN